MSPLANGTVVTVEFDGRGLAVVFDSEDGRNGVRYLADPARTSVYVREGETEWFIPEDLRVVAVVA
jgi:hypothetical protein